MKRILLLIACLASTAISLMAQQNLHVFPIFQGEIIPKKRMVETYVKGESLEPYKLTLFHSVKMNVDKFERTSIYDLVMADINSAPAESKDLEYGREKDLVSYCILRLPEVGKKQRYLCYQCYEASTGGENITLVYMEGSATMKDLRKTFKTK